MDEHRRWNIIFLQVLFSHEYVSEILKIPLSQYQSLSQNDSPKWTHHSEMFSIKSVYASIVLLSNAQNDTHSSLIWKKLWALKMQDCLYSTN